MATKIKDTLMDTFKLDQENVDKVVDKVKGFVHEGNVRRLIVKDSRGVTLIEVPLTIGLVGVALVPVWAAIGAIVAVATDCTLQLERREDGQP